MAAPFKNVLRSRVSFRIPDICVSDELDEPESCIPRVRDYLLKCFGGVFVELPIVYSSYQGTEKVRSIWSPCTTEDLNRCMCDIIQFAATVARDLGQDYIILEINNSLYSIPASV